MPCTIVGPGAMGCLWASLQKQPCHFLVKPGHPFLETDRFNYLPATTQVNFSASTFTAYHSTGDNLIIATKAYAAKQALQSALQCVKNPGSIFLLQNGMGSQQEIAALYPHLPIFAVSSTHGAFKQDPLTLVHAGIGIQRIGPLTASAELSIVENLLPSGSFSWHADIENVLWQKLQINAAINALTVIYQCANGELIDGGERQQHMAQLCAETDQLLEKLGIPHQPSLLLAEQVAKITAKNFSSMYQDVAHQRQTEIHYINGYIVDKCRDYSLPCPAHQAILQQAEKWAVNPS